MDPKIKLIERVWSGSICRNGNEIYTPELKLASINIKNSIIKKDKKDNRC